MVDVKSKQRVNEVWRVIEQLSENDALLPPVAEEKICTFEEELKINLPLDYRASLTIHEGSTDWLWDAVSISDIDTVISDWHINLKSASEDRNIGAVLNSYGPVRNDLFNKGWIPVAMDNEIPICIDINPLSDGVVGQMIYVDWEDGKVKVIHNSFVEFLEDGARKLESELNSDS